MTLSPEMQQQLTQLKDIHLPEPIAWYPFAVGWWIVLAAVLSTTALVLAFWLNKRRALKKQIIAELHNLADDTPVIFSTELSALLRRVAIYCHGEGVEALSGKAWSAFLSTGKHGFSPEFADFIANAPYAAKTISGNTAVDDSDNDNYFVTLRQAAERWINTQLKRKRPQNTTQHRGNMVFCRDRSRPVPTKIPYTTNFR